MTAGWGWSELVQVVQIDPELGTLSRGNREKVEGVRGGFPSKSKTVIRVLPF